MSIPGKPLVALLAAVGIVVAPVDGHANKTPTAPLIASPAWPDGIQTIDLTWTTRAPRIRKGKHGEQIPVVTVGLTLRAGSVERRFTTTAEISTAYSIGSQRACQGPPLPRDRVAELTLEGGGFQMFALLRGRDEMRLVREIVTDGICDPDPCPVQRTLLARFPVPSGVRFHEHFRVQGQAEEDTCP